MILKFAYTTRIDGDTNITVSSEVIVDTETEAEEAGEEFFKMMHAFVKGYGRANPDVNS